MGVAQRKLRIGDFCVDPTIDEISNGEATVKVEPRAMQVLLQLAAKPGEVFSVEELLNAVWSDLVVTPDSVYQTVAALRRAFGDDPKSPRYIVNVPRRGYRLVAGVAPWQCPGNGEPVQPRSPDSAPHASPSPSPPFRVRTLWVAATAAAGLMLIAFAVYERRPAMVHASPAAPEVQPSRAPDARSIAVLPFVDMSEKHDQEYFSDGLSEELIDLLAQTPNLQVTARTSSFFFKGKQATIAEIARTLGVAHILEGSVRRSGDKLRISAQLISADSGVNTWSGTYERQLKDVFKVQDDIAGAVVSVLQLKLGARGDSGATDSSVNTDAYNEYLLGLHMAQAGDADGFRRAAAALDRATQLDPRFAQAYASWAFAACAVASDTGTRDQYKIAEAALEKALLLAPGRANGYGARSWCRADQLDFAGALADAQKAVSIEPGDARYQIALASSLATNGRLTEAIATIRKAIELDPLNFYAHMALGRFLTVKHDWAGARSALRRALEVNPSAPGIRWRLGIVDLLAGDSASALSSFRSLSPEELRKSGVAMAEHSAGHEGESRAALQDLAATSSGTSAYAIGVVHAWRGENDEAFNWFERARRQQDANLSIVKYDPLLAGLRTDPRYTALLRELNLED